MTDGGFSWVGLLTSDIERATSFYGELFGWNVVEGDSGGYAIFRLGGEDVALVYDPAGARLSLWEPRAHPGPRRTGAIGTCCWNELATPDIARARRFYAELFGWQVEPGDDGGAKIRAAGDVQAGMHEPPKEAAGREPTRWIPYFAAESLAGGPAALLRDREGATFGLREA
jgi:predicted enzyme related to lactoylglutathione lyase